MRIKEWKTRRECVEVITSHLYAEEVLCQMAEEAAELAQAALKLRRAMDGTNPTPVTEEKAQENILEELADVLLCASLLGLTNDQKSQIIADIEIRKLRRWAERLEKADEDLLNKIQDVENAEDSLVAAMMAEDEDEKE